MYYSGNLSSGLPLIEGADDPAATLALLLRLVGRGLAPDGSPARLLVGRLPAALPVAVPLPDGSRVLGSQQWGNITTIVLDVDLPEPWVRDFYRERLQADGWTAPEHPGPGTHGGFAPTSSTPPLLFCRGPHGPSLFVQATAMENGVTDVQLNLNTYPRQPLCAPQPRHRGPHDLLPTLTPPEGGRQMPQGGGGGGSSYYSTATLRTDRDPAEVAAHYAQQLRAAGWTSTGEGQSGPVAWSTWTFRDEDGEEWRGLLFVLSRPEGTNEYMLYLRADWAAGSATSAGWTSASYSF